MDPLGTSTSTPNEAIFLSFGEEAQLAGVENKIREWGSWPLVATPMSGASIKTRTWVRLIPLISESDTRALIPDEDKWREINLYQKMEYYRNQISLWEKKILSKTLITDGEFILLLKLKDEVYATFSSNIIKEELEERLFEVHVYFASLDPIKFSTGLLKGMGSTEDFLLERRLERELEKRDQL
jgi:hypothetical protein